jgi:alpha-tubulin suppressor-like RCC1 family protein
VFKDQPEILKEVPSESHVKRVFAWGLNRNGELSLGKECKFQTSDNWQCVFLPTQVRTLDRLEIQDIRCSSSISVALVGNGQVLACGSEILSDRVVLERDQKLKQSRFE